MGFFDYWSAKEESEIEVIPTNRDTDFSSFKQVTDYIYTKSGIVDLDKRALTASRAQQYAITQNIFTTDEFLSTMKNNHTFYQEIINIATVNETYFLREVKELEWLINYIKNSNRNLKILSMPSSSGEEIYSILLMMCKEGLDINSVNITGYDINSQAIKYAISGEYNEHSLHKIDSKTVENYFTKIEDNHYKIDLKLKNIAKFEQKNIFDLVKQSGQYDIILSRNMFIYFDDENRTKALDIIANLLKNDGIYIKGHADHIKPHPNLQNIAFGIYKKVLSTSL